MFRTNCSNLFVIGNLSTVVFPCFTDHEMRHLRQEVFVTRQSAFAQGTYKNYLTQWRSYQLFCLWFKQPAIPCSLDSLILYAQFLGRSFKSVRLIMNYLYGVQVLHLLHDAQFPNLSEFQFRLFARGLSKRLPHIPKQAEPVTPVILLALYPFIDMHVKCHVALWASFLYAFFMMARKSNIVPPSKLKFDPQLYLCHGDITVCNAYVKVSMRWSKTNQDRSRFVTVPLPAIPGSPSAQFMPFPFWSPFVLVEVLNLPPLSVMGSF